MELQSLSQDSGLYEDSELQSGLGRLSQLLLNAADEEKQQFQSASAEFEQAGKAQIASLLDLSNLTHTRSNE